MRRLVLAVVLALFVAVAAHADRETAQFSSGRADKSLAAKKFDEAEGLYRKALEEDETFLPARFGLAQALVGGGKSALAVEELRKFIDDVRAAPTSPPEWKPLVARAEKQLADLDAAGAALQKIHDGYAEGLVSLGQRWLAKDPVVAERALRRALKVRPDHPKATELLEKLGKTAMGEVIDLFDGTTFGGWEMANTPIWQVLDGEIVATVRDATYMCRSTRTFEGDFNVRVDAKVLEEYPGTTYFALLPCWKSNYDRYSIGLVNGKVWWTDMLSQGNNRDIAQFTPPQLKKPFDAKQWNTYELRFRGKEVAAVINGDEIAKEPRPENRQGGFVGLMAQALKVAFRNVQVEVR